MLTLYFVFRVCFEIYIYLKYNTIIINTLNEDVLVLVSVIVLFHDGIK